MEPYERHLQDAWQNLRQARASVRADIDAYPTPVSGCDAQYNRLIADRTRIADALLALGETPFVATPRQQSPGDRVESR